MCFHSKQSKKAQELEKRFNVKIDNPHLFQPNEHINAFNFPQVPIIANNNSAVAKHSYWGLIPHWAKGNSIKKYTLNAKIETIAEKPSFRDSANKRCLVIADGFYEWQWLDSKGNKKQKYMITLPNDELFAFGGLWSEWVDKSSGEIIHSFTVVTTEANELMSKIHNSKKRMPVILTKENEQAWLAGNSFDEFRNVDFELLAQAI